MNEILQTLTEEQRKAVDWMIKNNIQDNGIKVTA